MELAPITYHLDEHEMPDHLYLTGTLDIEICHIDEMPYIWAFQLNVHNGETGAIVEHDYQQGRADNWFPSIELKNDLHRDTKLMDSIYNNCRLAAVE